MNQKEAKKRLKIIGKVSDSSWSNYKEIYELLKDGKISMSKMVFKDGSEFKATDYGVLDFANTWSTYGECIDVDFFYDKSSSFDK